MDDYLHVVVDVLTNTRHSRWISLGLMTAEGVLGVLIIWRIPYTEIDWKTYMQQVQLFLGGERDYSLIRGDTGPLVYPAIHLYIYSGLYYLTSGGADIVLAQIIFHILYSISLAFVFLCYRRVNAPPWLLIPLVLSKRLHSVFLLRLFNDAWATLGLWAAVYSFQRRKWLIGALAWCFALGVKMVLLLAAPAVGVILLQGAGASRGLLIGTVLPQLQLASALPFVSKGKGLEYLMSAFDFGRRFLFKWTVNWRFVGSKIFSMRSFAYLLLTAHIGLLLFFLHTRWVTPSSEGTFAFVHRYTSRSDKKVEKRISQRVTPIFIMDAMLGSMVIGLLCARSLHYQFYAYAGWSTPYLLWRSGLGPAWVLGNWAMQEVAWLTYPSTNLSSSVVVVQLFIAVVSVWWGSREQQLSSPVDSNAVEKKYSE